MRTYCWRFGEHKSDPCSCGWASDRHKASEIRQYLGRQMAEVSNQMKDINAEDELDVRQMRFLQGLHDGFNRVVLFMDYKDGEA